MTNWILFYCRSYYCTKFHLSSLACADIQSWSLQVQLPFKLVVIRTQGRLSSWGGQRRVCLFDRRKKKHNHTQYNVWQSVPYTALDINERVTEGGVRTERKHLPSKIMESVISTSFIGNMHVWWVWTTGVSLPHTLS